MNNYHPRTAEITSSTPSGLKHQLHWTEWGDPNNRNILFCAHGLSRNGRDFDFLARNLMDSYRVICVDYPGRGGSSWLTEKSQYHNEQYLRDSLQLLDHLDYDTLDWVGTSMGGLIGMGITSMPDNPIRKMVINDVGPFIPADALSLIGDYLGLHPRFEHLDQANEYYRTVYASFGALEDHHYDHFVEHGVTSSKDGEHYVLNYDPEIIDQFTAIKPVDIDIWNIFDEISTPLLILRGKKSQLLLPQTVEQMKYRHGNALSVEFADCGHAPSLMVDDQISCIRDWLLQPDG